MTNPQYCGVVQKRHSTDKIFFLLIIAMWVAMSIIGYQGIQSGNPNLLIAPIDDQGNLCGISDGYVDKKYFYTVLTSGIGVCISTDIGCPTNNTNFNKPVNALPANSFYCLNSVHKSFGSSGALLNNYIQTACYSGGSFSLTSNCGCMIKLASTPFLDRCGFTTPEYANKFVTQAARNQAFTWMDDIWAAKSVIFGLGIGLTVVLSFIYIALLRFYIVSSIVTWTMLVAVLIAFGGVCYLAYTTADQWKNANPQEHTDNEILALQVTSALFMVLALIWAIVMLVSRSSIQISLKMMSMTADAVEDMPAIFLTPLVQVIAMIFFLCPWAIYCFYIASSGTFSTVIVSSSPISYSYQQYSLSSSSIGRLWFMLFTYFWTIAFIMAIGTLLTSIAIANWYFSKPEDRTLKGGRRDLNLGYAHALRYHLGSAAIGSLIVAVVQMIRAVVLYLEKKFKIASGGNCCVKFLCCCCHCCLGCLEACVRYITEKAYIQIGIHGYSFCWGAKEAIMLVTRNPLRVFVLDMVCGLAMGLGRIMIVCICGATTYYILNFYYVDQLSGLIAPTLFTMVISYSIASAFSGVFFTVAATMIQCFITDEEKHNGIPIYCSNNFAKFVDDNTISEEEYQKLSGETLAESQSKTDPKVSAAADGPRIGLDANI